MSPAFVAHNIRLDDGTYTLPQATMSMEQDSWFISTKRVLETVFPGDKSRVRLADLGCLEGGYAVEFARMGFNVLGLEVRESNFAACEYVKANTNLPNLEFVRDDAWNLAGYGTFDAVFCCGLLYHFDRPGEFMKLLAQTTRKLLIVQTHFAMLDDSANRRHPLSKMAQNEGMAGRWYREKTFSEEEYARREEHKLASWDNRISFWPLREYLLQAIRDVGFDLVLEQFDSLGANLAETMLQGYYKTDGRGTFIGIKT